MAIKKKAILTDNIPPSLTTPVLLNNISIPFALGYPANVTFPNVTQPAGFVRPTQSKGFDITITDLTKPNPVYLNDLNGIFNLYSGALSDLCTGIPIQFDPTYITNRQAYNTQYPNAQILAAYPLDAILFSYPNNAWYRSLSATNTDNTINSTTVPPTPTAWKQITLPYLPVIGNTTADVDTPDVATTVPATSINFVGATVQANATNANNAIVTVTPTPTLVQQGRLTGVQGSPYGDTSSDDIGSPTLYFTPTYEGNLISLYNGTSWVTQTLPQNLVLQLNTVSGGYTRDIYVANTPVGLALIGKSWSNATPSVPTGRTKQDGRWVNDTTLTVTIAGTTYTIQRLQALLVGSINASSGAQLGNVNSWSGNRSIWNLYNQVSEPLVAFAGSIPPDNTTAYLWVLASSTTPYFRNQNYLGNQSTSNGIGRFTFLLDPLYNRNISLYYSGSGVGGSTGDRGLTGIIANIDAGAGLSTLTTPLTYTLYGNDSTPSGQLINNWHNLSYNYNYNSSSSGYTIGLNYIQKIEKTYQSAYFSDTGGGLQAEFWG